MKYYKVVNSEDGHYGLFYKEGRNIDPVDFNPQGDCQPGGIYFSREDIFAFLTYGDKVYEVTPISEIYENLGKPKKWKCKEINLKYIGETYAFETIKHLVEDGANVNANNGELLCWASFHNDFELVKYLVDKGANVRVKDDIALRWSATKGHLEIVKYLIEHKSDIHSCKENALLSACQYGHLDVVKCLVKNGADIHVWDDYLFNYISYKEIVKFLKSCVLTA